MATGKRLRSMALVDSVTSLQQAVELGVCYFTADKDCPKCKTRIRLVVKDYRYHPPALAHKCRQCACNVQSKRHRQKKIQPENYSTDAHKSVVSQLLYARM